MSPVQAGHSSYLRRSAVSVPVLVRDDQHALLLTRRPAGLADHASEICFPGGKVDAGDTSPLATACRELGEEVGISARHVLGYNEIEGTVTSTGFHIQSFVMSIAPGAEIRPDPREVSECWFLPLAEALALENYRIEKFSVPRDDFSFALPTPIGPVRNATCTLLLHLVKQIARCGGFDAYARTFQPLPPAIAAARGS